jgi:alpha-glucosidase (family GH31 glycosyl hydrolase)
MMDFNLFGVPMIGADICGFIYDTTEELCARWIEVGAFYPFSRNHNTLGAKPQELYLWNNVAEASRKALGMKYQLLPYWYSLFYQAHTAGDLVVRPLWAVFPDDAAALSVERQFMVGDGLLVSPVLEQGATSVTAYFPPGLWYAFASRQLQVDSSSAGRWVTLSAPLTEVNVHVRGGTVLPLQQTALTTTAGRLTPFTLFAALCPNGGAFGSLFWDDGEQVALSRFLSTRFESKISSPSSGYFTSSVLVNSYPEASSVPVQEVVVVGQALAAPTSATLNGQALASNQFSFVTETNTLTFSNLNLNINEAFSIEWK